MTRIFIFIIFDIALLWFFWTMFKKLKDSNFFKDLKSTAKSFINVLSFEASKGIKDLKKDLEKEEEEIKKKENNNNKPL